ncbi:SDR family oxidoreductase [Sphingomonas sp. HITSZ_GF]|uniref:SDR family NAD(P)-dependent oxidoreductase n=1 Tax=Sphingomonas sp. HITSZ_GF TaxID=3037247 RepID=UPI00240CEF85|nr:SDR family oxidoreductase [Sphingomonas sp. HITSZ_GF]MDG2534856.1 SDR family oxidoreductase [Sphingomonas sp. HITSZ_GF]
MTVSSLGTALITGASTGIGAVYADRLAGRGHDLILVARDVARMQALAERLTAETGRRIEVLPADLTDGDDLDRVAKRLANDADISLLVNNAGMSLNGGLLDNEAPAIERLVALNITAPALLAAAAGKAFKARGKGAIINIASVLALAPEMFDGTYSGSKAFLINLSASLAAQLEPLGVRVQAVLPGATRTEIWSKAGKDVDSFPPDFVMEVDDLVDAALVGFDKGETVTIPPLADEGLFTAYTNARLAMGPFLSKRDVAPRYRETVEA